MSATRSPAGRRESPGVPDELLPDRLTDAQREAITHTGSPLLVVAGPGAGKTSVMVRRAAWLVLEEGVDPGRLLVTTFTNEAAEELFDRLHRYLGRRTNDVHISTLHSFCRTVLEEYPEAHAWGAGFRVLDGREQFLLVYGRLKQLGLEDYPKSRKGDFIQNVLSTFNLCTEEQVPPDRFVAEVEERGAELLGLEKEAPDAVEEYRAVAEAYGRYRELLLEEGTLDFSTLQSVAWGILFDEDLHGESGEGEEGGPNGELAGAPLDGRDPGRADARREARRDLRDRYHHLLVDEYQDTNRLQVEILRSLARPDDRITAVGDDDQSIYGFRGASPSSFLHFEDDFPGARRIRLRTNFRSTPPLVQAASRLIERNDPERRPKELEPHREEPELPPAVVHRETSPEEAEAVVETLARWKEEGIIDRWSEVTLLFRSVKSYAGPYLEAFAGRGIPVEVDADGGFFDRDDVEQMKRLFTFCGWKRRWRTEALAGPVTGLSARTLEALDEWDGDPVEWTDPETLDEVGVGEERERRVLAGLGDLRRRTLDHEFDDDLLELFYEILEVTGYLERCCEEGPCGPEDPEREAALLNLAVFSQLLAAFHRHVRSTNTYRLGQYLRDLPWRHLDERSPEPAEDAVRVMTVHRAKGLEFPVVVLGAAMQNRFPGRYRPPEYPVSPGLKLSGDAIDEDRHYRDERRLFYVGMTRAEDLLLVGTADKVNKRGGGPSQFVEEVGEAMRPAPETEEAAEPEALEREAGPERETRERVSYSALHSYLLCPLQYYLVHEADFALPEHYYFEFGRLVHGALEILHRRAAAGEEIGPGAADAAWEEAWSPPRSWSDKREADLEGRGREFLRRYVEGHPGRFDRVRAVEEEVEMPVDPAPAAGEDAGDGPGDGDAGLVVGGRMDLICDSGDGGLEVIDFKARSRQGLDMLRPDYQVQTYGLAAGELGDRPVDRVVLHLLAEEPGEDLEAFEWTGELEAGARERLAGAARGIREGRFEPTPGIHCQLCDFRHHCPASEAKGEDADDVPVGAAP